MNDPRKNLEFALEKYPQRTQVAPVEQLVIESARQNDEASGLDQDRGARRGGQGPARRQGHRRSPAPGPDPDATCSTARTAASSSPARFAGGRNALIQHHRLQSLPDRDAAGSRPASAAAAARARRAGDRERVRRVLERVGEAGGDGDQRAAAQLHGPERGRRRCTRSSVSSSDWRRSPASDARLRPPPRRHASEPTPPEVIVLRFARLRTDRDRRFPRVCAATPCARSSSSRHLTATLERLRSVPCVAPLYVVVSAVLLALGFPATVLVFAGGAVFGALLGFFLAYAATLAGALLSFALARTLARDLVVHLLGRRLAPLEAHARAPRLLGAVSPALRAGAVRGHQLRRLARRARRSRPMPASTAIALVPVTFLYTYFASSPDRRLAGAERAGVLRNLLFATLAVLALSFLPPRIIAWRRRRAQRTGSGPAPPPADR